MPDAAQLAALEAMAEDFPWSREQFESSFTCGHFGWGIWRGLECVGFALFSQVLDEATLLNIATHTAYRRRGLAQSLLRHALDELRRRGVTEVFLEVRVSNTGAIALYRKLGFADVGRRQNYYPAHDGREDALVMRRILAALSV